MTKKTTSKDAIKESSFKTLYEHDFTKDIEEKGNTKVRYLPWASTWAEVKKKFPDASFEKHLFDERDADGEGVHKVPYMADNAGYCYVVVTVTIEGQSITDTFPVTDFKGKPYANPSSSDVYNCQQRALAKCIAFHGFGLRLYNGEEFDGLTEDDFDFEKDDEKRKLPSEPREKTVVEQAKENPVVKAVEKELGATLDTVSETDGYENVYDGEANLIHGFDDIDTLKFVFPQDCSLTDQEAYVNKHFDTILKTLDLDMLSKFVTENAVLFKSIANLHGAELKKHIHITKVSARKAELNKENN